MVGLFYACKKQQRLVMNFSGAFEQLLQGRKVRCPEWAGYWQWDHSAQNIRMHLKDGTSLLITETEQPGYTLGCIARNDFQLVQEETRLNAATFSFSDALRFAKQGKAISRKKWSDDDYVMVYKGQKDIAASFGYGFGEVIGEFSFVDVLAFKNGSNMVLGWTPSNVDIFANDWVIYEGR